MKPIKTPEEMQIINDVEAGKYKSVDQKEFEKIKDEFSVIAEKHH